MILAKIIKLTSGKLVSKKAVSSLPSVLKAGGKKIPDPIDISHKHQQLHFTLSLISAKI